MKYFTGIAAFRVYLPSAFRIRLALGGHGLTTGRLLLVWRPRAVGRPVVGLFKLDF